MQDQKHLNSKPDLPLRRMVRACQKIVNARQDNQREQHEQRSSESVLRAFRGTRALWFRQQIQHWRQN